MTVDVLAPDARELTWTYLGQTLTFPVVIRDASLAANVYTCPVSVARRILAEHPYEPASFAGRAVTMLVAVGYRDGDLGVYDEIGVLIVVKGPNGRLGPLTFDLPVTGEFTRKAGRDVWGLPKFMMEASIIPEQRQTRLEASADGMWILSGAVEASKRVPLPKRLGSTMSGFAAVLEGNEAGRRLRIDSDITGVSGLRVGRGGQPILWGQHEMALRARELGMAGRPLVSMTIKSVSMAIHAPKRCGIGVSTAGGENAAKVHPLPRFSIQKGLGVADHGVLGGAVGPQLRLWNPAGERGEVDHLTAAALKHPVVESAADAFPVACSSAAVGQLTGVELIGCGRTSVSGRA